jgi:hypothetical protein
MAAHWVLPGGLALWYGLIKAAPLRGVLTSHPYYMSIKGSILASGFEIYFNMLFKTNFSWQIWCIGFVGTFAALCSFAEPSRIVLPVVPFHHIPSGDFLGQSPL